MGLSAQHSLYICCLVDTAFCLLFDLKSRLIVDWYYYYYWLPVTLCLHHKMEKLILSFFYFIGNCGQRKPLI